MRFRVTWMACRIKRNNVTPAYRRRFPRYGSIAVTVTTGGTVTPDALRHEHCDGVTAWTGIVPST